MGVAAIECLGLVQFGVAEGRGVGSDAAEAGRPGRAVLEQLVEVGWVGAGDHEVGGVAVGRGVDGLDRRAERLARWQPTVGLLGEGDDDGHVDGAGGLDYPDRVSVATGTFCVYRPEHPVSGQR